MLFHKPVAGQLGVVQEMHAWPMIGNEGVKPLAITAFVKNFGEDRLLNPSRDLKGKNMAVSACLARGRKLPEGLEYEPLEGNENDNYSTVVTRDLDIKAGETQKVELEVTIPPRYWGFVLTVEQI